MTHPEALKEVPAFVASLFTEDKTNTLCYHTLEHTKDVVAHVQEIAAAEGMSAEDKEILTIAAWFHDVGHLNGGLELHEERSVDELKTFLAQKGIHDEAYENAIAKCILATKVPQHPETKLEEVICDADVYHFGTRQFRKTNRLVKEEMISRGYKGLTKNWNEHSLAMLQQQRYFTQYCADNLNAGKEENIGWLKEKLLKKGIVPKEPKPLKDGPEAVIKAKEKYEKGMLARGAQTFLRLGSQNHLTLSRMADDKARVLISVNSIIISVILSVFLDKLDVDTYLTIPTIIFLGSAVITVVIAILATRPKLTEGSFKRSDIEAKQTNLLFFGNFYKSSLEDYEWAMNKMLEDKDYMYGTMIKDIYFIGKVIGSKYKLIRLAYNVFMIGILLSVVAFAVAAIYNTPHGHVTIIDSGKNPY